MLSGFELGLSEAAESGVGIVAAKGTHEPGSSEAGGTGAKGTPEPGSSEAGGTGAADFATGKFCCSEGDI